MAFWGVCMALGAPGYGLWLLPWIALIPALLWVGEQQASENALKRIFGAAFWFGFAYFGVYCLWFFDLHPLTWMGFSVLESRLVTLAGWLLIAVEGGLLTGVLFLAYRALSDVFVRRPQRWLLVLLFPVIWVLGFSLLNATPMALPWAFVEYTQTPLWLMRWLAGWISGSGIALLVVFHNILWAEILAACPKRRFFPLPLLMPVLLAILTAAVAPPLPDAPWPIPVAVVQANLPIEVIRSGQLSEALVEQAYFVPLENAHWPAGTLVAFPEEGVVPGWVVMQAPERNRFLWRLAALSRQKQLYITVGVSALDGASGKRYNALALLSPDGRAVQFYRKRRLVPFGEYTPYGLGSLLVAALGSVNIDYSASFDAGDGGALLAAGSKKLGGLVCFELIDTCPVLGGYANRYRQSGADLLVNASNLGWFHQNPLLEAQFLAIGQMRAAEIRLPLVISSNTGRSAIVSPLGEIVVQIKPFTFSQHKTQVIFYNGKTRMAFSSP
jgi:apolipoprotein N-acyltransferase